MSVFAEGGFSAALTAFSCINTYKFMKKPKTRRLSSGLQTLLEAEFEEEAEVEQT